MSAQNQPQQRHQLLRAHVAAVQHHLNQDRKFAQEFDVQMSARNQPQQRHQPCHPIHVNSQSSASIFRSDFDNIILVPLFKSLIIQMEFKDL